MREAGRKNLQMWQSNMAAAQVEASAKAEHFRARMLEEFGGNPSVTVTTAIDSACVSLLIISLAESQLKLAPTALRRRKGLSGAVAAHQNSLLRCLRLLTASRKGAGMSPAIPTAHELLAPFKQ